MIYALIVMAITDGDTLKGQIVVWPNVLVVTSVRLKGIDTPELKGKCESEIAAAEKARARLAKLVSKGRVTIDTITDDKYASRVDAVVRVNGKSVGDQLVAEGLARVYTGGARAGWCP